MASLSSLLLLTLPLLLFALQLVRLSISRSGEQRNSNSLDSSRPAKAKPQTQETSGTLDRSMATPRPSATSLDAILQLVLDALHHLTGLPLLMVNQPDHNLPCLTHETQQQMRADQKNAALLGSPGKSKLDFHAASSWSDHEAPEEEMSDLSDEEEQDEAAEIAPSSTAQNQLFDGMQFYLAVSQVREQTVRSVLALGMAKTLTTLRERKQNESIAVIEQRYPDFTCLPTRSAAVRQLPEAEQPPMDLLAAMRLPSAAVVAQSQPLLKTHRRTVDEEVRVRRPSLPSRGPNIYRVA